MDTVGYKYKVLPLFPLSDLFSSQKDRYVESSEYRIIIFIFTFHVDTASPQLDLFHRTMICSCVGVVYESGHLFGSLGIGRAGS